MAEEVKNETVEITATDKTTTALVQKVLKKDEKLVNITPNVSIAKTFIIDRWLTLEPGEQQRVPDYIKAELLGKYQGNISIIREVE